MIFDSKIALYIYGMHVAFILIVLYPIQLAIRPTHYINADETSYPLPNIIFDDKHYLSVTGHLHVIQQS